MKVFATVYILPGPCGRRTEVGMIHGLAGGQPGLVVVPQQLVQEVQRLGADQVLVLAVDESLPPLTGVPAGMGTCCT